MLIHLQSYIQYFLIDAIISHLLILSPILPQLLIFLLILPHISILYPILPHLFILFKNLKTIEFSKNFSIASCGEKSIVEL